jgi:hypothetical protein
VVFEQISWEDYILYIVEHNHFNISTKNQYVKTLGPYKSTTINPKYKFYGIIDNNDIVGVTSLQEFDHHLLPKNSLRYRVLRINKEYRGQNLGWDFLKNCFSEWLDKEFIFGYIAYYHIQWALKHHFKILDNPTKDCHTLMGRYL